jgi:hypothetical protein
MIVLSFWVDAGIHKENVKSGKNSICKKLGPKYDLSFKTWLEICLLEKLKGLPLPLNLQIESIGTEIIFPNSSSIDSRCNIILNLSSSTETELTILDLRKELMTKYVSDFISYMEETELDAKLIDFALSPERLFTLFGLHTYKYRFCLFDEAREITVFLHEQS